MIGEDYDVATYLVHRFSAFDFSASLYSMRKEQLSQLATFVSALFGLTNIGQLGAKRIMLLVGFKRRKQRVDAW